MKRTLSLFLQRLGDTVISVMTSRYAVLPWAILLFIPVVCALIYWLLSDVIAGRKIGGME